MGYYLTDETSLTTVADAIRQKGGSTETLIFPEGFASAIAEIEGTGGARIYTATPASASGAEITFNVVGEPSAFVLEVTASSVTSGTGRRATTVVYDGESIYGDAVYTTGNMGACYHSTNYSWAYSGGALTITSDDTSVGGVFSSDMKLTYIIGVSGEGGGGGSIGSAEATPSANSLTISFTGVVGEPTSFSVQPTANITLASTRYVIGVDYTGEATTGVCGYTSGSYMNSSATCAYSASNFTWEYADGTLTITSAGASSGGYFKSGTAYQLVYTVGAVVTEGGATLQSKTVTPSAEDQTISPDSGYDGLSYVVVEGDTNLVAGNIKSGVSIFGVAGNYTGSGGGGSNGDTGNGLTAKTGTTTSGTIETGLSEIQYLVIYKDSVAATGFVHGTFTADDNTMHYVYCSNYSNWSKSYDVKTDTNSTVSGGTFTWGGTSTSALSSNTTYNWIAVGVE